MKILVDMNLSPRWVALLQQAGWDALHWSAVGDPCAPDAEIMRWARENGYIVFTHDLDFGALLAATWAQGPSVIQIRVHDVMPEALGSRMVQILQEYKGVLEQGALVTVDEVRTRIRVLPLSESLMDWRLN